MWAYIRCVYEYVYYVYTAEEVSPYLRLSSCVYIYTYIYVDSDLHPKKCRRIYGQVSLRVSN